MSAEFAPPSGVWLPLITPFKDEAIDAASLRRLVRHYASKPVDGLIVGATTGEGLTLDEAEIEQLVMLTAAAQRDFGLRVRSEERRVGKECWHVCRSRWSPYH